MSRVAKSPVEIPGGVKVTLDGQNLKVKGGKAELELALHENVEVTEVDNTLEFAAKD